MVFAFAHKMQTFLGWLFPFPLPTFGMQKTDLYSLHARLGRPNWREGLRLALSPYAVTLRKSKVESQLLWVCAGVRPSKNMKFNESRSQQQMQYSLPSHPSRGVSSYYAP